MTTTNYLKFTICTFLCYFICFNIAQSQEPQEYSKKNSFYLYWGYNRSAYLKSNVHFNGPNYDFTLYDIKATDRPAKFGWVYLNPTTITVPQYNFRIGYFIKERVAFSIGIDHLKYVVTQNQETTISGIITESASSEFEGTYLNEPIILEKELLEFEHSDGLNLVTLDVEYLFPFKKLRTKRISTYWNFGLGGIWVVTKTNVKVFGDGLDNDFHIAGYTLAGKTGPRIEFMNRIFLLCEVKGGYASLNSVLIKNAEPEIGDHNISYIEYYVALGVNWSFKKKSKRKK